MGCFACAISHLRLVFPRAGLAFTCHDHPRFGTKREPGCGWIRPRGNPGFSPVDPSALPGRGPQKGGDLLRGNANLTKGKLNGRKKARRLGRRARSSGQNHFLSTEGNEANEEPGIGWPRNGAKRHKGSDEGRADGQNHSGKIILFPDADLSG